MNDSRPTPVLLSIDIEIIQCLADCHASFYCQNQSRTQMHKVQISTHTISRIYQLSVLIINGSIMLYMRLNSDIDKTLHTPSWPKAMTSWSCIEYMMSLRSSSYVCSPFTANIFLFMSICIRSLLVWISIKYVYIKKLFVTTEPSATSAIFALQLIIDVSCKLWGQCNMSSSNRGENMTTCTLNINNILHIMCF